MRPRLVVIGGDAAGATGPSTARRLAPSIELVMFERGHDTSYSACGIPYWIGGDVESEERLIARTPDKHRESGIDVRIGTEVTAIDPDARTVEVDGGATERWDLLLIATGGRPIRPPLAGIERAFGVQTLDDARALMTALEANPPRTAVVAGGGYIGLEMAESFVKRGVETHLIEAAPHVMSTLDPDMAMLVENAASLAGVHVHTETALEAVEDGKVLTSQGEMPADVVVLGLGSGPESSLAERSAIPLGAGGAVATDDRMATPVPGVWSAGDCAEVWHRVARRRVSIQLGTVANKAGRVAGINIAGGHARFGGVLGTAVSKICEYEVARTGLTLADCTSYGIDACDATIKHTTRAGYYPGAGPIDVRLIGDRATGRVLGGQIVGKEGAAKRIDVVATAIWNDMRVDEMIDLDLSYAPPFSGVWDPVLVAARALAPRL